MPVGRSRLWKLMLSGVLAVGGSMPAVLQAQAASEFAGGSASSAIETGQAIPGKVLVKYKTAPRERGDAYELQSVAPRIAQLTFSESIPVAAKLQELLTDPNIEYAEPVYPVKMAAAESAMAGTVIQSVYFNENDPVYMKNWGKTVTGVTYLVSKTTPEQRAGIRVAVLDTGIDLQHPDLAGAVETGSAWNFVNPGPGVQDDNGHGTHVSGIIAAKARDGSGYTGAAPDVRIIPVKVLNHQGKGDTASLLQGLEYAIAQKADIINVSLGSSVGSRLVHEAIQRAAKSNVLIFAASGNESNHWIGTEAGQLDSEPEKDTVRYAEDASYPAAYDEVVSVGALEQLSDGKLTIADFSNIGKIDLVAPGVNIYSTLPPSVRGMSYGYVSGTSQATPLASATAALLKAYNRNLNAEDIKTILKNSARGFQPLPAKSYGYRNLTDEVNFEVTYGAGMFEGRQAFELPRLQIKPQEPVNLAASRSVTFDISLLDLGNRVVASGDAFQLMIRGWQENKVKRSQDSEIAVVEGRLAEVQARIAAVIPSDKPVDVYRYYYQVKRSSGTVGALELSNRVEVVKRPVQPVASLSAGTYAGSRQVSLSTTEPGAEIYFVLETASGTTGGLYRNQLISIANSGILHAVVFKNGVYSDETSYRYIITAPAPGGGAGGGPGGGFPVAAAPKQTDNDTDGRKLLTVAPKTEDLLKEIASTSKQVLIDATTTDGAVDRVRVKLSEEVVRQAKQADKPFVIQTAAVELTLPAGFTKPLEKGQTLTLTLDAKAPSGLPAAAQAASRVYEFTLQADQSVIRTFDKPVTAVFRVDLHKVNRLHQTWVYTFDEVLQDWTYAGGQWSADQKTMKLELPHFSRYAVLDYNRSFADLEGHWARQDIERMVAQQVVRGLTEQKFVPDEPVSRAQFVTLLARGLKLPQADSSIVFEDVPAGVWYSNGVYAAYRARLVSGISETRFLPEANITREQMAVMLVQAYLHAKGQQLSDLAFTQEVKFDDEGTVSPWARTYVRAAAALELMKAAEGSLFKPQDAASRAQAAVVIARLLDNK